MSTPYIIEELNNFRAKTHIMIQAMRDPEILKNINLDNMDEDLSDHYVRILREVNALLEVANASTKSNDKRD